jgi:predicted RNA binding protein YcfA (HicA-like mRNA interferase family)
MNDADRNMTKDEKRDKRIRRNPGDVRFSDFAVWMEGNGFSLGRVRGSHHVFIHPEKDTPVNAQKRKDGKAKAYQVRQAIRIIDGE